MPNDIVSLGIDQATAQLDKPTRPVPGLKAGAIYIFWGLVFAFRGAVNSRLHSPHHPQAFAVVGVWLPLLAGCVLCAIGLFLVSGMASLGSIAYQQVSDPRLEQRTQKQYAPEIGELASLGFSYEFTSSESLSLARILLGFPAIVLLRARSNGEILAIRAGRIGLAAPVLCSSDGRVFAHVNAHGVAFQSEFLNGPLLVTKDYPSYSCERSQIVVNTEDQTIGEAWAMHQQWLKKLETENHTAIQDRSFAAYAERTQREDAFIKSETGQ